MTDGLATNHVDQVLGTSVLPMTTRRLLMMNAKTKLAIFQGLSWNRLTQLEFVNQTSSGEGKATKFK
jgi:hypothetical protein